MSFFFLRKTVVCQYPSRVGYAETTTVVSCPILPAMVLLKRTHLFGCVIFLAIKVLTFEGMSLDSAALKLVRPVSLDLVVLTRS